jgi:lipopolysaccharide transport system ATP-binding protein
MSDVVLKISDLGKCYKTYRSNLARFASWFGFSAQHKHEYWAVMDVNFSLRRGEALAIIGQNGAGKSTLLKLITGTIRSSTGSVQINGRISAILELGLGFNPDFTGRQNVYLAGGLMGLSTTELGALMPSIKEFAEIGEFFEQPLRVYSSGMQARLAFAVATAVRPDVLIIDEILSVGDSYFQHKSFARIRDFSEQGTSILLVTHGLSDVRTLCDRVILLDSGCQIGYGPSDEVIDYYGALIADKEAKAGIRQIRKANGVVETRSGSLKAIVKSFSVHDAISGSEVSVVQVGQRINIQVVIQVKENIERLVVGILIRDRTGHVVWGTNTWHTRQIIDGPQAGESYFAQFVVPLNLGVGSYSFTYNLVSTETLLENNYESADNFMVLEVINTSLPIFAGTTWLDPKISISRI